MTRRREIELEIERLAAEITVDSTLSFLNSNYEKRQLLYTEWLAQSDFLDTDLMVHQPRLAREN